jgi:hypothetical protein
MSLVLPNGSVVGHRHMKRYYDQKLKPEEVQVYTWFIRWVILTCSLDERFHSHQQADWPIL